MLLSLAVIDLGFMVRYAGFGGHRTLDEIRLSSSRSNELSALAAKRTLNVFAAFTKKLLFRRHAE